MADNYRYMEQSGPSNELIQMCSNYRRYDAYLSRVRYARIPLNNVTGTTVQGGVGSTNLMEFKIPSRTVFNPAQSFTTYQHTINGIANNFTVVFEANQDFCQWVYFGNGGGLGIVDLNYADRYTSVVGPLRTSQQELTTRDRTNTLYTSGMNLTGTNGANLLPFSQDGLLAQANSVVTPASATLDPQYLNIGTNNSATAADNSVTTSRVLPLSTFKDTFIGQDKNVIFGNDMYLRFNTQYSNRLGFYTTDQNNPQANVTPITTAIPFTNVALFLAIEENKVLVDSLMSALMAGSIKMVIPYTYTYRFSSTGSNANLSITLTRQFGHKLKRLLYSPFVGAETSNLSFDHSNVNGSKITSLDLVGAF